MSEQNKWWQNAVVYQIYPRSFQDSLKKNGTLIYRTVG